MKLSTIVLSLAFALVGCGEPQDDDGSDDGSGSPQGGSAGSGAGVSGSGGGGSGSGGAGGSGGSGGATACNTNEPNAPDYPYNFVPDPAPTPTGGTIADGTYFVTSVTWYRSSLTGNSLIPGGIRIDIAGNQWNEADGSPDGIAPPVHFTFELEVMSPNLVITQTCPSARAAEQYAYSVEADTLTVFITDGPEIFGMLLTRQ